MAIDYCTEFLCFPSSLLAIVYTGVGCTCDNFPWSERFFVSFLQRCVSNIFSHFIPKHEQGRSVLNNLPFQGKSSVPAHGTQQKEIRDPKQSKLGGESEPTLRRSYRDSERLCELFNICIFILIPVLLCLPGRRKLFFLSCFSASSSLPGKLCCYVQRLSEKEHIVDALTRIVNPFKIYGPKLHSFCTYSSCFFLLLVRCRIAEELQHFTSLRCKRLPAAHTPTRVTQWKLVAKWEARRKLQSPQSIYSFSYFEEERFFFWRSFRVNHPTFLWKI